MNKSTKLKYVNVKSDAYFNFSVESDIKNLKMRFVIMNKYQSIETYFQKVKHQIEQSNCL